MKDQATRETIAETIRAQSAEWMSAGRVATIREIGDGWCEEFADELMRRLSDHADIELAHTDDWWARVILPDGTPSPDEAESFIADVPRLRSEGAPLPADVPDADLAWLIGGATHVWLTWGGLHFDATAPDGEPHFLLMPFFADQIAGHRAARAAA